MHIFLDKHIYIIGGGNMSNKYYSEQFVELLKKKPKEYTLKDKIIIMDCLQGIFNCNEVAKDVNKNDLIFICDMLARIAYVEMDRPNTIETVEYERENMIAIARALKLVDDDKIEILYM